jgi:hypothetical protein
VPALLRALWLPPSHARKRSHTQPIPRACTHFVLHAHAPTATETVKTLSHPPPTPPPHPLFPGAKSRTDINQALENIYPVLKEFRKGGLLPGGRAVPAALLPADPNQPDAQQQPLAEQEAAT